MVILAARVTLAWHIAVAAEMVSSTAPTDEVCLFRVLPCRLIVEFRAVREPLIAAALAARLERVGAVSRRMELSARCAALEAAARSCRVGYSKHSPTRIEWHVG